MSGKNTKNNLIFGLLFPVKKMVSTIIFGVPTLLKSVKTFKTDCVSTQIILAAFKLITQAYFSKKSSQ